MSSSATIATDTLLPDLTKAIVALQERQSGCFQLAWLAYRRYNELIQNGNRAKVRPALDLPIACFFPGHEAPLAEVLSEARKQLEVFADSDWERGSKTLHDTVTLPE